MRARAISTVLRGSVSSKRRISLSHIPQKAIKHQYMEKKFTYICLFNRHNDFIMIPISLHTLYNIFQICIITSTTSIQANGKTNTQQHIDKKNGH